MLDKERPSPGDLQKLGYTHDLESKTWYRILFNCPIYTPSFEGGSVTRTHFIKDTGGDSLVDLFDNTWFSYSRELVPAPLKNVTPLSSLIVLRSKSMDGALFTEYFCKYQPRDTRQKEEGYVSIGCEEVGCIKFDLDGNLAMISQKCPGGGFLRVIFRNGDVLNEADKKVFDLDEMISGKKAIIHGDNVYVLEIFDGFKMAVFSKKGRELVNRIQAPLEIEAMGNVADVFLSGVNDFNFDWLQVMEHLPVVIEYS